MREFLRSTIYALLKKGLSMEAAREAYMKLVEIHGIDPVMAEELWNRMVMVSESRVYAPAWDFGWWDISYWCAETEEGKPLLPYIGMDGKLYTVETTHMGDPICGGFWDASYWDMCYWTQDQNPFRVVKPEGVTQIQELIDKLITQWRSRWLVTPLAVANYQTAEERIEMVKSKRVESYGIPVSHSIQIESFVDNLLTGMKVTVDAVKRRMYKSAALELYSILSSPHKWGLEGIRVLDRSELKSYWVHKWSTNGLDANVLSSLFDRVINLTSNLAVERVNYRIRTLQYRLARR